MSRVYKKCKYVTHPAYVQAQRQATFLIKKVKKEFESKLAKKNKEDKKSFFAKARSKIRSTVGAKLEQSRTVKVNCTVKLKLKLKC